MIQQETMASAVGAKTARACDICVRRRARWYCAADDAFLCQSCDDSVHTANPLARRHDRVRLNTAASCLPTWHRGPTKKPRTPRHRKKSPTNNNNHQHLLVPELDTSTSMEEEDEQLLYRVPVYEYDQYTSGAADLASGISHGFLPPSDFDMAEFAADVKALLGKGLDGEQSCGIEDLGLLINPHESDDSSAIKIEKQDEQELAEMEVIREPFEFTFDYDSPLDLKVVVELNNEEKKKKKKECKMLLRLDYAAISSSWGSQGSPWMNGEKPNFNPDDDFWPLNTMGDYGDEVHENGRLGLMTGGQTAAIRDGGREARVSRYREKRRTRLFSKKIRYEVRKLNAEKRPRMKGRFVKRSSFS